MPIPPTRPYADEHVFEDGQSFKNVRDAIVAASAVNMWHISHEMAQRYRVANMLCLKCGTPEMRKQKVTYFTYRDKAIRICLKCTNGSISLR